MELNTVICILCNGTVNFKKRDPGLFNAHMRDQHNIFYRTDYLLASCFMQGHQLDKVEEDWANMERMEDVIEVDQEQNVVNDVDNGLNFEALEDEEVLEQSYDEVGVEVQEVQEVVQLEQEEELPMEEEEGEGRKRKSNGALKCDVCEETYGAKGALLRHYKKSHSLDGTKRERTEMESEMEDNSQMEEAKESQMSNSAKKRKPNGNGEFKCGQCEQTYSTKGNLNVHMKKVHGWEGVKKERMETVEDDMAGYESEASSTGEYYTASDTEKTTCDLCTRTFKSPGRLSYHMMTKHKDVEIEGSPNAEERRIISCEQCPKKFVSKTGLRGHTKSKHDNSLVVNADGTTTDEGEASKEGEEEKKSHPCLNCPKGYMSIQALVRHTKESHGETVGEVGSESTVETEPNDTLESKSGEAPGQKEFVCAFGCGKSYSHKTSRDNHEIKEHNRALKKKGRGKAPVGSTFHLSSQDEEELVLEEGVADVSEVVDAEVEAAQNNLAQMEEEVAKAKELVADATEADGQEEEEEKEDEEDEMVVNEEEEMVVNEEEEDMVNEEVEANAEEEPVVYTSFNPLPADPREEWRETQPITPEEEKRFQDMLLNTKENAVENEMPILPPFVEQEEEEEEEVEKKKTEPELEEKVEATETNKEEKVEGKEKGSNVHVDLTRSEYFAKHPKAIANPQERSVKLFTDAMEGLPEGWKVRTLVDPKEEGKTVRHYLSPDCRVLKTGQGVMEYLRLGGEMDNDAVLDIARNILHISDKKINALLSM